MLTKRIIPCLDVKDNQVVKGIRFRNHKVMGDIIDLATRYRNEGADELVFYDITASSDGRSICRDWVTKVAKVLDIPFCVAGGIRTVEMAGAILEAGADKISINSPALENPELINELVNVFGTQCIVIGIDSYADNNDYFVYQYTGDVDKMKATQRRTIDWAREVVERGAGEIVLNCMNLDGVKNGYDISQLKYIKQAITIPLIASGGAGNKEHFRDVFLETNVEGALAASVFHSGQIPIPELKAYLRQQNIEVRT